MEPSIIYALIAIGALVLFILLGVPIAYSLGIVGLGLGSATAGWDRILGLLPSFAYTNIAYFAFTVIPLFILMGNFAFEAGIAEELYYVGYKWLGKMPGGLVSATILACGLFAAICGSSTATAATIGKVSIRQMESYGYKSSIASGAVAIGGTLGPLIPPSIVVILVGGVGMIPIGRLLIAITLPGILLMVAFIFTATFIALVRPGLMPRAPITVSWRERIVSLKSVWSVLVAFVVVIGGIYAGIFTPTEAASAGVAIAFVLFLVKRKTKIALGIKNAFLDTLDSTTMIFAIIIASMAFNTALMLSGFTPWLVNVVTSWPLPPLVLVIVLLLLYLPLGTILEVGSAILITVPLFLPIVRALGFDLVWFGVLVCMLTEVGTVTPPVALNVFVVHAIAPHIPLDSIYKGIFRFLVANIAVISLVIAFPQIALFLPRLMKGS